MVTPGGNRLRTIHTPWARSACSSCMRTESGNVTKGRSCSPRCTALGASSKAVVIGSSRVAREKGSPDGSAAVARALVHDAALHHKAHVLGDGDVGDGIAGHGDDVGQQPFLETAAVVFVDELGCHGGRGAQRLDGAHAP